MAAARTATMAVAGLALAGLVRAERAVHDARFDPKTGLLTARAWQGLADRRIARARRRHTPMALLMIDVDDFKAVNDQCGHLVGDQVLATIGRCLSTAVRSSDAVGRFGGDEFVALLQNASPSAAEAIAARISAAVSTAGPVGISVGVSVGIATMPHDARDTFGLLAGADQELYAAKAARVDRLRSGS